MPPLVLPLGLLVGLTLGAVGGGGSVLTVPALVHLLGQEPHEATTGSLVIVGITSLIALVPHARRGDVRFGHGLAFGLVGIGGSVAGSAASATVQPEVLLSAFSVLILVVAAVMLRRSLRCDGDPDDADDATVPVFTLRPFSCAWRRLGKVVLAATAVGLLTGFFGVGGGFAVVPALVLALAFPMSVAVGTSLLVIAVNSGTALLARVAAAPDLDWKVVAGFTAAAVVGSLVGGRIAARARSQHLVRAFVALLVVVALYTAATNVPALFGA